MIDHLTDDELEVRIAAKLHSGELPMARPQHMWGGPSAGQICAGCNEKIAAAEAEVETNGNVNGQRFYHARCYNILSAMRASME